jgi:hypothetical protein
VKTHQHVVWRRWSVTKLASITFLSLAFSNWIDYLGFITEERLAAVLIIPSLGVPNWSVIYIINTAPSSKFSGAVAGERRRRSSHVNYAPAKHQHSMLYFVDQDCVGACHLKNYSFVITYLLEDELELSLGMLDTSQTYL